MSPDDNGGYGRPPKASRFRKGVSGNLLGRPRKIRPQTAEASIDTAYLAEARRAIRVTEGNKSNQSDTLSITVRRQAMAAISGDTKAQREFLGNLARAEAREGHRVEKLIETALDYIALCDDICDDHRRRCLPPPEFEIDPASLVIDLNARTIRLAPGIINRCDAAFRACAHFRKSLALEKLALKRLLAADTSNATIARDLVFVEKLLLRHKDR